MGRHHRIDYVEFTVVDLAVAKAFYGAALGWEFNDYGDAYVGFRGGADGREAGGFALGTPQGGGPLVIVYSDDIDASLSAVVAAGGTVTCDLFEFPGGRRFHASDPFGNEFAVWTEADA